MGVSKNKGGGRVFLVQVGTKSVNIKMIACRRQKMATTDTGMIADKQQLIKKRKMDDIICMLETADRSRLLEKVIEDVGSGYHMTHFHDPQQ